MKASFLSILALCLPGLLYAGQPTCHTTSAAPYCRYIGPVSRLDVDEQGHIIVFFDVPMDEGAPTSVGINGVANYEAAATSYIDNPEFSEYFFSTALSASASGQQVTIQMRGTIDGYLKMDRIWVVAP